MMLRHTTLCALALTGVVLTQPVAAQGKDDTARRALLIGINKYASGTMKTLNGAVNDVDRMASLLQQRFGFAPGNVLVLKDGQATRKAILNALRRVVGATRPGDWLYVHFSGHGSQVKDLSGDEEDDGLDETFVPHDGRTEGVPDVVDDELHRILQRLDRAKATIVLDCCHAGTGTRSLEIRHRSAPVDDRLDLYRGLAGSKRMLDPSNLPYYVFTAAKSAVTALDGPVDGVYHGFFTYAFSRALEKGGQPTAQVAYERARSVLQDIQAQFGGSVRMREPNLEGRNGKFSRPFLPPPVQTRGRTNTVVVTPTKNPRVVILKNARRAGGARGSSWAVYAKGEKRFQPGRAIALGTVVKTKGRDSLLMIKRRRKGKRGFAGCRAVRIAPPKRKAKRVAVHIAGGSKKDRKELEKRLRSKVKRIAIVKDQGKARFTVDVAGRKLRVVGADGLARATGSIQDIARVLKRSAPGTELASLANPASAIEIEVEIAGQIDRGVKAVSLVQTPGLVIPEEGDEPTRVNTLQIAVRASQDCYLTIVDVDQEGGINLLFPYPGSSYLEDGIPADEKVLIPDRFKGPNEAGFQWVCCDPAGLDTIRVFATTDLATAEKLRETFKKLDEDSKSMTADEFAEARAEAIGELRGQLLGLATRGIRAQGVEEVDNKPVEASTEADETNVADALTESSTDDGSWEDVTLDTSESDETADWTAASVPIRVRRKE